VTARAARLREAHGVDVQAMHGDDGIVLPDLEIGELVVGRVMGAYTWASASTFNFFPKASILILDSAQKQKLVAVA
jgi:ornithine decarboxylase